ncbi:MAG TPA: STAS domain-containing protein [Thermomonas sp.]|jgi:anti-anti-sigma factor
MTLDVKIHPLLANGNQRVVLDGRLDTHTYGALDDRLSLVLAGQVQYLTLDLERLAYISSAGVRSVFRARKLLEARGGKVLVANAQPQVQKVFDIVKAVPLSEIFRSVEEADAYLDRIQKKILADDEDE